MIIKFVRLFIKPSEKETTSLLVLSKTLVVNTCPTSEMDQIMNDTNDIKQTIFIMGSNGIHYHNNNKVISIIKCES